jgi:hypothetical protein
MLCYGRRPHLAVSYDDIDNVLQTKLTGPGDAPRGHRKGLSTSHVERFLNAKGIGFSRHVYRDTQGKFLKSDFPYYKYLYAAIETGCPAIIVFRSSNQARHVITVLGHTFNEDAYRPHAETGYHRLSQNIGYIPSEQWMSNLIVHDDNFGGEHCLPTHYFNPLRIGYVLGTLPDKAEWDPTEAELAGVGYLYSCLQTIEDVLADFNPWCARLATSIKRHDVAVRTIHQQKDVYLNGFVSPTQTPPIWPVEAPNHDFLTHLQKTLPDSFYAVEFSLPDLYSANRRKLGEVLLRCDKVYATNLNFDCIVGMRAPSFFFEPSGKKLWPTLLTGIESHLPLSSSM